MLRNINGYLMTTTHISNSTQQQIVLTMDIDRYSLNQLDDFLKNIPICSVILYTKKNDERSLQAQCAQWIKPLQELNCAVLIAQFPHLANRLQADGFYMEDISPEQLADLKLKNPQMIVGVGGIDTRDDAMHLGEIFPDFILFGRLGLDKKPAPLPRNLSLASWWAEVMEISCIVQAGSDLTHWEQLRKTKAEFIALEKAIFDPSFSIQHLKSLLLNR